MVVPDYQLVAEVMLFSEGFDAAPWLAGKMVHLYKLASEQLSQQVRLPFQCSATGGRSVVLCSCWHVAFCVVFVGRLVADAARMLGSAACSASK
jgi:hypothetical protein